MSRRRVPKTTKAPRFRRAFTVEQIEQFERDYNSTHGVNRRVAEALLCKSSGEMLRFVWDMTQDAESMSALTTVVECIADYEAHLVTGLLMTRKARGRLLACASYFADRAEPASTTPQT